LLCSPFITQSLAAGADGRPPGIEMAGVGGPMVLRLVRQDFYHQAWQAKFKSLRSRSPSDGLGSYECSITGPKQKLCVNKGSQKRVACGAIQIPQSLRLRGRQTKTRHLDVFALNTPEDIVERLLLYGHLQSSPPYTRMSLVHPN
jgi:hypothetical protein